MYSATSSHKRLNDKSLSFSTASIESQVEEEGRFATSDLFEDSAVSLIGHGTPVGWSIRARCESLE